MLIWSRFGIVVPILWIAIAGVAVESGLENHVSKPYSSSIVILLTGIICFVIGRYMNKNAKQTVVNESGQAMVLDRSHSFFFVKVENWLYVSIALAILFVVTH